MSDRRRQRQGNAPPANGPVNEADPCEFRVRCGGKSQTKRDDAARVKGNRGACGPPTPAFKRFAGKEFHGGSRYRAAIRYH